jgi:hypothetical protein
MDGSRFDQIARGMATGSSRRTMLKGLGGGVLAALELARAGGGADADDTCKPAAPKPQSKCKKDAQCCPGLVCQATGGTTTKRCQSGCRIGGTFYASGAINPANPCQSCQPGTSTTAWSNTDCSPFACDPVTGTCFSSCDGDEACVSGSHCAFVQSEDVRVCCPAEDFCEFSEVCCDPGRSPTATCCPADTGGCCECFISSDPGNEGYLCCEPEKLCGTAPNDRCCHNDEGCVDGRCCHQTFQCEDRCCDRPCCGDVCCAQGTECVNDTCVAQNRTCDPDAAENRNCLAGEICASIDDVCCTTDRVIERTVDIDGVPTVLTECCAYGSGPSLGVDFGQVCCSAPDFCSTSRGSITRP